MQEKLQTVKCIFTAKKTIMKYGANITGIICTSLFLAQYISFFKQQILPGQYLNIGAFKFLDIKEQYYIYINNMQ